jgi:hypothetical protein
MWDPTPTPSGGGEEGGAGSDDNGARDVGDQSAVM